MLTEKERKVIHSARSVFLRYGYKRVTMNDIAEASEMSRPAVYLIFPNKEEVFKAVVKQMATQNLNEICQGLNRISQPKKQLLYAFELWTVRPFELIMNSPDAKELIYCCYEFSKEIFDEVGKAFEAQLVTIIEPLMKSGIYKNFSAKTIAHMLRSAAHGFKEASRNSAELRQMIEDFLEIILFAALKPDSNESKITRILKEPKIRSNQKI